MFHMVTVAIHWTLARWGLKPLVTRLFAKPFVHTKNSTCFTVLYCWPFVKEGTPPVDDQWIPITKGQRQGKRFCIISSSWTTLSWWLQFEITYWTITPIKIVKLASIRYWSDTKVSYWCLIDVALMVSVSGTHYHITQKLLPLPCLCVVLASGPLFASSSNLVKSPNCMIGCYNDRIALTFDRHFGSTAAEVPVKFQGDWKSLNPKAWLQVVMWSTGKTSVSFVNRGTVSKLIWASMIMVDFVDIPLNLVLKSLPLHQFHTSLSMKFNAVYSAIEYHEFRIQCSLSVFGWDLQLAL